MPRGAIDGLISPRAPSCFDDGEIGWLFGDPTAAARDYYRRTAIFPIMHLLGVRRELAERRPWQPVALLKAFTRARDVALEGLADCSATKSTLPL